MSGTTFKRGDILLVPFPYSDMRSEKKRPVLALTAPDRFGDFVALAITSNPTHDEAIELYDAVLVNGKLPKKSWVRVDKVFTLESVRVVRTYGTVADTVYGTAVTAMCSRLGLEISRG